MQWPNTIMQSVQLGDPRNWQAALNTAMWKANKLQQNMYGPMAQSSFSGQYQNPRPSRMQRRADRQNQIRAQRLLGNVAGGMGMGGGMANPLQSLLKSGMEQQAAANAANEKRYQEILKGYDARQSRGMELADARANQAYEQMAGDAAQAMVNRGMSNSTEAARKMFDAFEASRQIPLDQFNRTSGDKLAFMERKNEVGPDLGQLSQLAQMAGQAQSQFNPMMQQPLSMSGIAGQSSPLSQGINIGSYAAQPGMAMAQANAPRRRSLRKSAPQMMTVGSPSKMVPMLSGYERDPKTGEMMPRFAPMKVGGGLADGGFYSGAITDPYGFSNYRGYSYAGPRGLSGRQMANRARTMAGQGPFAQGAVTRRLDNWANRMNAARGAGGAAGVGGAARGGPSGVPMNILLAESMKGMPLLGGGVHPGAPAPEQPPSDFPQVNPDSPWFNPNDPSNQLGQGASQVAPQVAPQDFPQVNPDSPWFNPSDAINRVNQEAPPTRDLIPAQGGLSNQQLADIIAKKSSDRTPEESQAIAHLPAKLTNPDRFAFGDKLRGQMGQDRKEARRLAQNVKLDDIRSGKEYGDFFNPTDKYIKEALLAGKFDGITDDSVWQRPILPADAKSRANDPELIRSLKKQLVDARRKTLGQSAAFQNRRWTKEDMERIRSGGTSIDFKDDSPVPTLQGMVGEALTPGAFSDGAGNISAAAQKGLRGLPPMAMAPEKFAQALQTLVPASTQDGRPTDHGLMTRLLEDLGRYGNAWGLRPSDSRSLNPLVGGQTGGAPRWGGDQYRLSGLTSKGPIARYHNIVEGNLGARPATLTRESIEKMIQYPDMAWGSIPARGTTPMLSVPKLTASQKASGARQRQSLLEFLMSGLQAN